MVLSMANAVEVWCCSGETRGLEERLIRITDTTELGLLGVDMAGFEVWSTGTSRDLHQVWGNVWGKTLFWAAVDWTSLSKLSYMHQASKSL